MINKRIKIKNKLGLHARAAAKLVNCASSFASEIEIIRNDKIVNGKSIMGLLTLGAAKGVMITLKIKGEDEQQAFDTIAALINNKFDESE